MTILVLGLVVFLGVHSLRIIAPGWRDRVTARLGEGPFKGLYSLVALIGFVLIIWGFSRAAGGGFMLYAPAPGLFVLPAIVMAPALILAVASALPPGHIKRAVRNPLLIGTILWAGAHLFVNGEIAAVVLFGAFLVWAILDLWAQPAKADLPMPEASVAYDVAAVAAGLVLYAALVWRLHEWAFGVSPMV